MRGIEIAKITDKLVDEVIGRFLFWSKIYLETKPKIKKRWSAEEVVENTRASGQIDEQLYIIKQYASIEQKKKIKNALRRDFSKFF